MPFVLNNEIVDTYGSAYSITLNEDLFPIVTALSGAQPPAAANACAL